MHIVVAVPHFTLRIGRNESGLAEGYTRLGHEATVLTTDLPARFSRGEDIRAAAGALPYGLEVLPRLPFTLRNPVPLGVGAALRRLAPDVVHSCEDTDVLTILAFKAARRQRIAFVLSTERYYVPSFPKSIPYSLIERLWTRKIREGAEVATTHSSIQQAFWEARGVARRDVRMIPVGVWTDTFKPGSSEMLRERYGLPDDAVVGFTAGRMTDYKDYPTMMRAMADVVAADRSIHLVVAGFGPLRAQIVQMSRNLGLEENVHFSEDPIPHTAMPDALRSADFYLQTSSVEPFGIAVVEAMACGLPVVVTDVGGMSETVVDGLVGFKAPMGDARKVGAAVLRMKDDSLRTSFGQAGRARAVERYDWLVVCKQYLAAYRQAAESAPGSARETAAIPITDGRAAGRAR